jgi:hypothetical protein
MIIKRVGPLSCAKIAAVIQAVIGLFVGVVILLFSLLGAAFAGSQRMPAAGATSSAASIAFGVGAVILGPLLYGLFGFIITLIAAWIYNIVAARTGGIEIDLVASELN